MSEVDVASPSERPGRDTDDIARLCRRAWGLAEIEIVDRPTPDAGSSALYQIRSGEGSFLLKQHGRAYAVEDVERGARTAALLAVGGFPTPAFRQTLQGTVTARIDGRLYSLRSWVEGRVLDRQEVTPAHVTRLGSVLGWCHRLLADVPIEAPVDWWGSTAAVVQESGPARVVQELDRLAARIRSTSERATTDDLVLEAIAERRNLLEHAGDLSPLYAPCPFQVVHGDYHRGNVLWAADGALAGVIDVEGYAQHRVREVFRAITFIQPRVQPAAIDPHVARTFVQGYLQEAPLRAEELRRGPALLRWRMLRGLTSFRVYVETPHDQAVVARIAWEQGLIRWLAAHGQELGEELASW